MTVPDLIQSRTQVHSLSRTDTALRAARHLPDRQGVQLVRATARRVVHTIKLRCVGHT